MTKSFCSIAFLTLIISVGMPILASGFDPSDCTRATQSLPQQCHLGSEARTGAAAAGGLARPVTNAITDQADTALVTLAPAQGAEAANADSCRGMASVCRQTCERSAQHFEQRAQQFAAQKDYRSAQQAVDSAERVRQMGQVCGMEMEDYAALRDLAGSTYQQSGAQAAETGHEAAGSQRSGGSDQGDAGNGGMGTAMASLLPALLQGLQQQGDGSDDGESQQPLLASDDEEENEDSEHSEEAEPTEVAVAADGFAVGGAFNGDTGFADQSPNLGDGVAAPVIDTGEPGQAIELASFGTDTVALNIDVSDSGQFNCGNEEYVTTPACHTTMEDFCEKNPEGQHCDLFCEENPSSSACYSNDSLLVASDQELEQIRQTIERRRHEINTKRHQKVDATAL